MGNRRRLTIERVDRARALYLNAPGGLTDTELADALGVTQQAANKLRHDLGAKRLIANRYTLAITPELEALARAVMDN